MEDKRNEQRKAWMKKHPEIEKKPSMLRHMSEHDYQAPSIYMITIVVKDHKPLLGTLQSSDDNHPQPWVELTSLPYHNDRKTISREQGLKLNELARIIAEEL